MHADLVGVVSEGRNGRWAKHISMEDPAVCKLYDDHYIRLNPWISKRDLTEGNVIRARDLVPYDELFFKSKFYTEFMRPNHLFRVCSVVTETHVSHFVCAYACRSIGERAFSTKDLDLCRYLARHFKNAARIERRIGDLNGKLDQIVTGELDIKTLAGFDLTPSETNVATALFKGGSAEEHAREKGVSVNTVRTHMQRLYDKTGAQGLPGLLRLLQKKVLV
jgi:DNA-binding CsgD family transcriptional regulator